MSRKMIVISSRGLDNRYNLEGRSLLGPTVRKIKVDMKKKSDILRLLLNLTQ